jgi:hypothetical protein
MRVILCGLILAIFSCLCVPSPQSIKTDSFAKLAKMALWLRFLVGMDAPVPRKVSFIFSI